MTFNRVVDYEKLLGPAVKTIVASHKSFTFSAAVDRMNDDLLVVVTQKGHRVMRHVPLDMVMSDTKWVKALRYSLDDLCYFGRRRRSFRTKLRSIRATSPRFAR